MLLPITNISGKSIQATIEFKESFTVAQMDASLLLKCPELDNLRNLRVIGGLANTPMAA